MTCQKVQHNLISRGKYREIKLLHLQWSELDKSHNKCLHCPYWATSEAGSDLHEKKMKIIFQGLENDWGIEGGEWANHYVDVRFMTPETIHTTYVA